jgi:hypothetical protein
MPIDHFNIFAAVLRDITHTAVCHTFSQGKFPFLKEKILYFTPKH